MSEIVKHIKDLSDGTEVAQAISLYVNSYTNPGKEFYEHMLAKSKNAQHNFTMLCFEWFRAFAKYPLVDLRCEASANYAAIISHLLGNEPFGRQTMSCRGLDKEYDFYYRDDASAADLIERYLRLSKNNNAFIGQMLCAHNTIQQSFSRMCCEWFKVLKKEPVCNKKYIVLAQKAAKYYTGFPLI